MKRINTEKAPQAIGPYVQGVMAEGKFMFISGQVPLVPETGELVSRDTAEQVARCMKNLGAILESAGLNYSHLVKTNIYVTDISGFEEINRVYGSFFSGEEVPARAVIQVSALPKGANVEIEGIAQVSSANN